jgi:hypothetical protein
MYFDVSTAGVDIVAYDVVYGIGIYVSTWEAEAICNFSELCC